MSSKWSLWAAIAATPIALKLAGIMTASWRIILILTCGPVALALLLIVLAVGAAAAGSVMLSMIFGPSAEQRRSRSDELGIRKNGDPGRGDNLPGAPYVSNVRRGPMRGENGE